LSLGTLAFSKYHGLGNDFLIVDLREHTPVPSPELFVDGEFAIAKALCDRRYGVGGDGVLTLGAPTTEGAVATMRVLNADGTEAEMCGNGLRCVAKHLLEAMGGTPERVVVDTKAGALTCTGMWNDGEVTAVTVDMGRPRLLRGEIPMTGPADERCVEAPMTMGDRELKITGVSMGNPHATAFVPETGADLQALAIGLGATVKTNTAFPRGTNAEFAHMHSPTAIELWVWERGCGITQACGTGACATAVAACLTGRSACDTEIEVTLPGGPLAITVASDYATVFMRGPAVHVYDGSIIL